MAEVTLNDGNASWDVLLTRSRVPHYPSCVLVPPGVGHRVLRRPLSTVAVRSSHVFCPCLCVCVQPDRPTVWVGWTATAGTCSRWTGHTRCWPTSAWARSPRRRCRRPPATSPTRRWRWSWPIWRRTWWRSSTRARAPPPPRPPRSDTARSASAYQLLCGPVAVLHCLAVAWQWRFDMCDIWTPYSGINNCDTALVCVASVQKIPRFGWEMTP